MFGQNMSNQTMQQRIAENNNIRNKHSQNLISPSNYFTCVSLFVLRSVKQDIARCESAAVLPVRAFKTANSKYTYKDTGSQGLYRHSENCIVSVKVAFYMGCMYDIWRYFRTSSRRPDINTEHWPFIKLANI